MKFSYIFFVALLLISTSYGQSIQEVYMPRYVQGVGSFDAADDRKVPFVCRLTINGLNPNATYRYYNRFVKDPAAANNNGDGNYVLVKQTGDFVRVTSASLSGAGRYGEFTTDGAGSYTGWFANEVNSSDLFIPGTTLYFRIMLNNGGGGGTVVTRVTASGSPISVINFSNTATGGTGIRSTPATAGIAKNFVMLYDNAAGTGRPIAGTLIENDGTDNSVANGYAAFYGGEVNAADKTWGTIIPNNLPDGIKKIVQYSLADGTIVGYKTSEDGSWPQAGGDVVSTVNATGGLTNIIVLDGSIVALNVPVQQSQTITFNPLPAKTYGDAEFSAGATASSNFPVTYTSNNHAVATITADNKIHIVSAGTADITAAQSGNTEDFFPAASVTRTLTVNKASLTITARDQVKVQGNPLPSFTVSYAGFVNGEDETVVTDPPEVTTTADENSPAGDYPITVDGATAPNYDITYVPGNLKVTSDKQTQVISFNPLPAKTYGDADFSPDATTTSGLEVTYSSSDPAVAVIVDGRVHIAGSGVVNIIASQGGDINFERASDVSVSLTVNKAALTVRADDKSKFAGQPNPPLTISYEGLVNNETSAVFTTLPLIATTASENSTLGDYVISVSGATAANYDITHVNGTLTVKPLLTQAITFSPLPVKKYGVVPFAGGAKTTSGLAVTYRSSDETVAIIEGDQIRLTGAGTAVITATQPGNDAYEPAEEVSHTLTVQRANLVIRVQDAEKIEGSPNPSFVPTYSGFVNGDDVTSLDSPPVISTVATTQALAGKYPIVVSAATSDNYNIAHIDGTLTVLPPQGSGQDYLNAHISSPGELLVTIYSALARNAVIQLFDQYGSRLLQEDVVLAQGQNTYRLDVGNAASGYYFVRAGNDDFILKTKLVIP